jgi:hypothetical protein
MTPDEMVALLSVTTHVACQQLTRMLGGVTGDRDLARLMSSATLELRACDADGAAREVERHLRGLQFMGRLACGASTTRTRVCC